MFVVVLSIALIGYVVFIIQNVAFLQLPFHQNTGIVTSSMFHLVGLVLIVQDSYWMGPLLGLGGVALLLVWVSVLLSAKMKTLQPALLSMAVIFLAFGLLSPNVPMVGVSKSVWIGLHLMLILSGYVACIIAGILGGAYLFVRTRLKSKDLKGLSKYPPLKTLADYNMLLLWIGLSGLSTGVLAGLLWAASNSVDFQWDGTVWATFALLFWYACGLVAHYTLRNERWSAWFSIGGVCSLVVFFFLSAIIGEWHLGGLL